MHLTPDSQFFYVRNNERQGPVTGSQLAEMAASGQLQPADLVWCNGMAAWAPASTVEGLFSAPVVAAPALPVQAPQPAVASPASYAPSTPPTSARDLFPCGPHAGANFGLMLLLVLVGFFIMMGSVAVFVVGAAGSGGGRPQEAFMAIGALVMFAGVALMMWGCILGIIYMYRAWCGIQGHPQVETSPGKAVGFMFIPFFSLYWVFIAYGKWAKQYNEFVRMNRLQDAPPASEGLFTTFCVFVVLGIIPFVNYIVLIPQIVISLIVSYQMCRAVNYLRAQAALR